MSTLPLISHHLFVSALATEENAAAAAAGEYSEANKAIPVEVLDYTDPRPSSARTAVRRSLRVRGRAKPG